jgi:subfamily B ATP-binding cassette protein HlyB/CyaB
MSVSPAPPSPPPGDGEDPSPIAAIAAGDAVVDDPAAAAVLSAELAAFEPFARLDAARLVELAARSERRQYRLGQTVLRENVLPAGVLLVRQGRLRMLAPHPSGEGSLTIDRLQDGAVVGWAGLVRQRPCEHLRASTAVQALFVPAADFLAAVAAEPAFAAWFHQRLTAAELHQLLVELVRRDPGAAPLLAQWTAAQLEVALLSLPAGTPPDPAELVAERSWWVSSGGPLASPWSGRDGAPGAAASAGGFPWLRLIGLVRPVPPPVAANPAPAAAPPLRSPADSLAPRPAAASRQDPLPRLRLPRASGPREVPMALAVSLSRFFAVPLNRDGLRDFIDGILRKQPRFNLVNAGQLIDHLGLRVVLSRIPRDRLGRVPVPAVLLQHGQLVLLDGVDEDGRVRLLEPELGPLRLPPEELQGCEDAPDRIELLLVQRHPGSKDIRFGWAWFLPYLRPHTRGLVEVLAASVIVNLLALVTPLGMQVLVDQVARFQNIGALLSISALLLLASIVTAVMRTLRTIVFAQITNRIDQDSKATILDHLVRLPQDFFDSRPVGHVMYYFNVLDRLREFLVGQSLTTFVDFLFSFFYILVLLAISPRLTLVTLSTLPLLLVVALISNPLFENQVQRTMARGVITSSYLNESITGIQTIKSQNAELKTRWEFLNRYAAYIGEDFKLRLTSDTTANITSFVTELNGLLVIGFGIWLVMQNQLTLGGFIAFRIISGYITRPLMQIVVTWQQFRMSTRQMQLVSDIVDRPTEQTDAEASNIPMPPIEGHVRFENVGFRFVEEGPMVLQGINLDVPTGAFVGMVGGSGSGKSTLLKLLPRFYRALEGKVLIDGLDVSKVELYSLRRQVGVVPQDSLLFDGTIRENLLLVKPDASVDELIRAARIACAHDFIMEMPQGYNSSVGERGAGLSGGQRQRLALARAVLQNPRLLILDEATSALDARTERQVCKNLFEAFRGRTVFFITHRLSTVRPADTIVLMDRGAVMEVGSHDQLMERRGWYYALFRSQLQEGLN